MADFTKSEIEKLLKIPGEVRGVTFKTDAEFVVREKGEEGLNKLEARLAELNCLIKYREIENMNFYPIGLRIVSLYAIKDVFGFDNEKINAMGKFAPKTSMINKFFMQYFLSLKKTIGELSKIWKRHYTVGDVSPLKVDEKGKIVILKLDGADFDSLFCCYLLGYISKVLEMIVGAEVSGEETKCTFRGDNYHEYSFKW